MNEKPFWTPPEPEPAPAEESADEPFLRRWSRLKSRQADAPAQPEPAEPAAPPVPVPGEAAAATEDGEAAEPPGEEELPPLETLDENSDYSAFMSPRVSPALRKQALRKLFRSQKFNYICELDDYIDDYTSFPALGDIITADMKHAAEMLLKKQLEAGEAGAAAGEDGAEAREAVAGAHDDAGPQPDGQASEEPGATADNTEEKQRDA